jgi:biotin transport system substrate-specific component
MRESSGRVPWFEARDIARIAVFAALIAVLGMPGSVSLLGGVPITAQTLGVMLAGAVLGPRKGPLAVLVLLVLVAAGLPLLAGGRGGLAVFLGPTAGYLLGWVLGAWATGVILHASARKPSGVRVGAAMLIGGVLVIHAVGLPVQSLVTRLPLAETVLMGMVFVPGDLVKAVLATMVTMTLLRAYPRAFARTWRPAPSSAPAHAAAAGPDQADSRDEPADQGALARQAEAE